VHENGPKFCTPLCVLLRVQDSSLDETVAVNDYAFASREYQHIANIQDLGVEISGLREKASWPGALPRILPPQRG
jgi:hypothetical protein